MNTTESQKAGLPNPEATASSERVESAQGATRVEPADGTKHRDNSPPIGTLAQLISAIYGGRFKRTTLTKAEIVALRTATEVTEAERTELFNEAQLDRLLERTRQLMLLGLGVEELRLQGSIREFARGVLERHPLFQPESQRAVLANLPEAMTEEEAVKTVLQADGASLGCTEEQTPLTKKQGDQCRKNAALCLLMLFWGSRGTSVERIQRCLYSTVWTPGPRGSKSDREMLYTLISTGGQEAASVISSLLNDVVAQHKRQAEIAARAEERASSRVVQLEEQVAQLDRQLTEATAHANRLQQELEEAKQRHETARVHWEDDFEQLRGRMMRRLREELSLLDEGLHALRREPPKVHVMIDHAERAIDGLKREMERLRRND